MADKKINIIDLFCGTGGFSHGFRDYNQLFEVVYMIDLNKFASETAKANNPDCLVDIRDIRNVEPKQIGERIDAKEVDVLIGGPPCQGFSSLRPNRSSATDDERNDLFLNFVHFVEVFRPKVVVMENVVGLLTHKSGNTLNRILECFHQLGYNVDWRILNAASYGVPQKRERFILIAARDRGEVLFPEPTHQFNGKVIGYRDANRSLFAEDERPVAITVDEAISDLPPITRREQATEYAVDPLNEYQRARRNGETQLTLHKAANHSDKMMEVIRHSGESISSIPKHLITSGFSSCYSRLSGSEPSTTITVKFQSPASSKCIHPSQDRTITPREAARIQSFNDSFIFKGPLTHVASQLGNAVPPLLGQAIARACLQILGEKA